MNKILETLNLPRLNEEETDNLSNHYQRNQIINKRCTANKSPRLDGFTGEFYQTFKEKLTKNKIT